MVKQALLESLTRYVRLHYQAEVEAKLDENKFLFAMSSQPLLPDDESIESIKPRKNLNKIKVGPTFSNLVMQFMRLKNIESVDFYKSISVSRQLFSKIISHEQYRPTKDTVFKFAIGMRLTVSETNLLLHAASFAFQTSSYRDLYIQAMIDSGHYDPMILDEVLVQFNCKPLFSL